MDAALFAASGTLAAYLPKCMFESQTTLEHSSMAVTIGLSLGIFSLCILEAAPTSWLLILSPDAKDPDDEYYSGGGGGFLTISSGYWLGLWAQTLVLLVALPSLWGTTIGESLLRGCQQKDRDDRKYPFVNWRKFPWWCRFIVMLFKIVAKNLYKCVGRFCRSNKNNNRSELPVLATTINNNNEEHHENLRTSTSTDSLDGRNTPANSPRPSATSTANNHKNNNLLASIGSICGVSVVLVVVSSLGPLVVHTTTDKSALSVLVSWLCAVGFIISSILNGFGSVSMPYTCLSGLYLKPVRPEVITKLESERQSVFEALVTKRKSIREMTVSISPANRPTTVRQVGSFGGMMTTTTSNKLQKSTTPNSSSSNNNILRTFSDIGEELTNRRHIIESEIVFLEDLYKEMGGDIDELRHTQIQAAAARTFMGRVRSYVGLLFSVILLVRLVSAGWSIWQSYTIDTNRHRVAHGDVVTTVLIWLTGHHIVSPKDFAYLSQIVSLVMTLLLSFSQVRTFLRAAAAVNRRFMRFYQKCNCTARTDMQEQEASLSSTSEGSLSQIIAMITGCYCLSCIVVLKMMLPEEFCGSFATALGGMDVFTIHTSVVNGVFTCSAAVSVAMLGMLFGIQRQNNHRHTTSSSTEKPSFKGPDAV